MGHTSNTKPTSKKSAKKKAAPKTEDKAKDTRKIGITEQLLLLEQTENKEFTKQVRSVSKKLAKRLAKKIEEASIALTKNNSTEGYELIELYDPWSTEVYVNNPTMLTLSVQIPGARRAALQWGSLVGRDLLMFIPESYSFAVPIDNGGVSEIFALIDPDEIVDVLLTRELFLFDKLVPTGVDVMLILTWLNELIEHAEPSEDSTSA